MLCATSFRSYLASVLPVFRNAAVSVPAAPLVPENAPEANVSFVVLPITVTSVTNKLLPGSGDRDVPL